MSSPVVILVRCAPRVTGVTSAGGSTSRAMRISTLRFFSSAPLVGSSHPRPLDASTLGLQSCVNGRTASALPHTCHRLGRAQQRLLSMESETRPLASTVTGDDSASQMQESEHASAEAEEVAEAMKAETEDFTSDGAASREVFLVQVGGIPFEKTVEDVENFFADGGCNPVKITIPLRPDQSNRAGQNKGRAYVEFSSQEQLDKALQLSHGHIGDRWVTVSQLRTPLEETRTVRITTVRGMTEAGLIEILERELGTAPMSIRIAEREERSYGVAFVEFERAELAQKAVELDGTYVMGRWLDISLATFPDNNTSQSEDIPRSQPFAEEPKEGVIMLVRGLPFELSEEEIKDIFTSNGMPGESILQMRVPKHYRSASNTGIAYILVKDDEAAQQAISLKGTYVNNRWVDVGRWFSSNSTTPRNTEGFMDSRTATVTQLQQEFPNLPCVMVKGIPFEKNTDDLERFLEGQGIPLSTIEKMVMPKYRQTANNMGMAWLVINDGATYNRMLELSGTVMDDRWLSIGDA